ncbi:MAG: hypothetical protein U0931_31535 [Vulcanimicrobiota bacterium]
MFDVASGECELVDFLLTRFDPIDLKTKIKFDPSAKVDEQFAPPKDEPEAQPLVPTAAEPERQAISLELNLHQPLPNAAAVDSSDPNDGYRPASAPQAGPDTGDLLETDDQHDPVEPEVEPRTVTEMAGALSPPSTAMGPDWSTLMEEFNKARQRYHEEVAVEAEVKEDESP